MTACVLYFFCLQCTMCMYSVFYCKCIHVYIHTCVHVYVQDTAVLNVVNLTAVKIVAPIKRLQTKTQVKVDKFSQKTLIWFTCN